MSLTQDELERQLKQAADALSEWADVLKERGVADDQRHRDPIWRNLSAECRQLKSRLKAVGAVEEVNQQLAERRKEKAEQGSAEAAPKPKKKKKEPKSNGEEKSQKKSDKKKTDKKKGEKKKSRK